MSPRYLGAKVVLVKSFARIHETNLKKQGILPLTFANPKDYDLFEQADRVSVVGLQALAPGPACRGPDPQAGWPDRHDPDPPQPDRGAHRLVPRRVGAERAVVGSSGRPTAARSGTGRCRRRPCPEEAACHVA